MAAVGYVANDTGSAESLNIRDALENYGHTVTLSTQAAFTSGTFSGQDVVVVGPTDRDDAAFVADLDTHMSTHGVPVVCLATDGLSAGEQARDGGGTPDSTAAALGLIAVERRSATDPDPADTMELRTDNSRTNMITNALFGPDDFEDQLMLGSGDDGMVVTELPEVRNPITGAVIEQPQNVAGVRLLVNEAGFTILCAADAGDDRVGVRTGETFDTRAVFFGVTGSQEFGREGAGVLNAAVVWVQDDAAANDFDPSATGNGVVLAYIDLSPLATYDSGSISWTEVTPGATTVTVEVSDDDGATFSAQSNGGAIPVLSASEDVSEKRLLIKVTLDGTTTETPELSDLVVVLNGELPALQDMDTSGNLLGTLAPDSEFLAGQVIWITGNNAGTAMEIREWDSGALTIRLWAKMELEIQAGDVFDIRPGCQKRFIEDCVNKFGHSGTNNPPFFRGEPHVPGTDQITKTPDRQ